jgi:hypothetical protein
VHGKDAGMVAGSLAITDPIANIVTAADDQVE